MPETTVLNPGKRPAAGGLRTILPGVVLAGLAEGFGLELPAAMAPHTDAIVIAVVTYLGSVARNIAALYPESAFTIILRVAQVVP